jgi:hypothetical protein
MNSPKTIGRPTKGGFAQFQQTELITLRLAKTVANLALLAGDVKQNR